MKKADASGISLKEMEMFLTVARHKSFSDAANSLFINQSVVSRMVSGMEQALGVELFIRKRHGVELTSPGKTAFREFSSYVSEYKNLIARIKASENVTDDTIVIGVLEINDTENVVRDIVKYYMSTHPGANIQICNYGMRDLMDHLMCDILSCIFTLRLGMGCIPNVYVDNVVMLRSYFCVNSKHKGISEKGFDPRSLDGEVMYLTSVVDFVNPEDRALGICRRYGFKPSRIQYVPNRAETQLAVKNGLGFSIDGNTFKDRYPNAISVFPIENVREEQHVVALHKDTLTHQPTLDFIKWIKECRFKEGDPRLKWDTVKSMNQDA